VKLSVCLIVKNEEANLAQTLPNLAKHADQLVVVDTGSTDRTKEIAKQYGAEVYDFAWINDFAAARNASLKYATGDWILWVDADEYMTEADLLNLKQELSRAKGVGCALRIYESPYGRQEKNNSYLREKVFKNGLGIHFERPVNEQVRDSQGNTLGAQPLPVAIYHWGKHLAEARMAEKRARYLQLFGEAIKQNPQDAYYRFMLANKLRDLNRLEEAVVEYEAALRYADNEQLKTRALECAAQTRLRQNKLPAAAELAARLQEKDPLNAVAASIEATLYLTSGRLDEAIAVLTQVLARRLAPGGEENLYNTRFMPNFLLGKAYELKGERDKAAACLAAAQAISADALKDN
jgi:glycosyltransferase involved in cell wall biosynthesis